MLGNTDDEKKRLRAALEAEALRSREQAGVLANQAPSRVIRTSADVISPLDTNTPQIQQQMEKTYADKYRQRANEAFAAGIKTIEEKHPGVLIKREDVPDDLMTVLETIRSSKNPSVSQSNLFILHTKIGEFVRNFRKSSPGS